MTQMVIILRIRCILPGDSFKNLFIIENIERRENMNKKLFVGSIIAVVVLIGVSFISVVGYRSVASDVKASPLFNIRSSRAIDSESGDLSCEYIGKGEVSILSIPRRNNRIELIHKFLDIIRKMDDKAFNIFISYVVSHLKKNGHSDIENEEIVIGLNELKTNIEGNNIPLENWENPQYYSEKEYTIKDWKVGCFLLLLIGGIITIIEIIGSILLLIVLWRIIYTNCPMNCYDTL